jgi:hypothetical protein
MAADRRCPGQDTVSVREAFTEEAPRLLALPDNPYPLIERVAVKAGKTPYVRFDLNDYSIPHTKVQRLLTVLADPNEVRIIDGAQVVNPQLPYLARTSSLGYRNSNCRLVHIESNVRDRTHLARLPCMRLRAGLPAQSSYLACRETGRSWISANIQSRGFARAYRRSSTTCNACPGGVQHRHEKQKKRVS